MFKEQKIYTSQLYSSVEQTPWLEVLERFREAPFKIAIQKDGELTGISKQIIADELGILLPFRDPKERRLLDVSNDGNVGFMYTRNKDICRLVASGAVDLAIVGFDRIIEDDVTEKVFQLNEYIAYSWPLVIATSQQSGISKLDQIKNVATQYPKITEQFFAYQGQNVNIIESAGGTEVYPYITYNGNTIDAIIDLSVTGASLHANGLIRWDPPILSISPIMIIHPNSMNKYMKQKSFFK